VYYDFLTYNHLSSQYALRNIAPNESSTATNCYPRSHTASKTMQTATQAGLVLSS